MSFARTLIQSYGDTYAILGDIRKVDTAVVFVHGFTGDAVKTWLQFQVLTRELEGQFPWWAHCDLYFWDYPSTQTRILMGAQDLRLFVEALYPQPSAGLLKRDLKALSRVFGKPYQSIDLGQSRKYENLMLVGHSQGAVLIRQAIMNVYNEKLVSATSAGGVATQVRNDALLRAQLRLFAPALMGSSPSGLLGFLMGFFLTAPLIEPILRSRAGFNDIQASNPGLLQLLDHTEAAAGGNPRISALRARILFGAIENAVHPGAYRLDTIEPYEKSRNHSNICKPTRTYTRPLSFVRHE